MLDKLMALGHLTLVARDGVVTLSVRGDSINLDITSDSVAGAVESARLELRGDVSAKISELEAQIERLKAAL